MWGPAPYINEMFIYGLRQLDPVFMCLFNSVIDQVTVIIVAYTFTGNKREIEYRYYCFEKAGQLLTLIWYQSVLFTLIMYVCILIHISITTINHKRSWGIRSVMSEHDCYMNHGGECIAQLLFTLNQNQNS